MPTLHNRRIFHLLNYIPWYSHKQSLAFGDKFYNPRVGANQSKIICKKFRFHLNLPPAKMIKPMSVFCFSFHKFVCLLLRQFGEINFYCSDAYIIYSLYFSKTILNNNSKKSGNNFHLSFRLLLTHISSIKIIITRCLPYKRMARDLERMIS